MAMNIKYRKTILLLAAFAVAGVGYLGYRLGQGSDQSDAERDDVQSVRPADRGDLARRGRIRVRRGQRIRVQDGNEHPADEAGPKRRKTEDMHLAAEAARRERLENRENSDLIENIAAMVQQELTEEERIYLNKLRDALNSDDNKRIIAVARLAVKSDNSEVKQKAIDALGWVGEEALPELSEFLMDEDEEVVQAAIDKWEEAIRECENEADIINNTMLGMMAIKDEAACDYLSMNLIKSGEATLAVDAIINLMACDNEACHRPAKEAYEWITDKEWSGAEAAKAWIAAHPDL